MKKLTGAQLQRMSVQRIMDLLPDHLTVEKNGKKTTHTMIMSKYSGGYSFIYTDGVLESISEKNLDFKILVINVYQALLRLKE